MSLWDILEILPIPAVLVTDLLPIPINQDMPGNVLVIVASSIVIRDYVMKVIAKANGRNLDDRLYLTFLTIYIPGLSLD